MNPLQFLAVFNGDKYNFPIFMENLACAVSTVFGVFDSRFGKMLRFSLGFPLSGQ
jgi:hypothetical protein